MDKEFIPYEEALALKELGFNEECLGAFDSEKEFDLLRHEDWIKEIREFNFVCKNSWYSGHGECISAPLYQQAFRWFREKYCLESFVRKLSTYYYHINDSQAFEGDFKTYEEAELACLRKLIEIVKEKL